MFPAAGDGSGTSVFRRHLRNAHSARYPPALVSMSSFDFNTALSSRENYDGESPEGLEDYFIAVDDQMWAKGELAHAQVDRLFSGGRI